jgi:hypothetical protein
MAQVSIHERSAMLVTGDADALKPFTPIPIEQARALLYLGVPTRHCKECGCRLRYARDYDKTECNRCRAKLAIKIDREFVRRSVMLATLADGDELIDRFGWSDDD